MRDEIAFGPLNMGLDRDEVEARVDDTLAMLDIADLADRAPYQLSGGQKKRVAIASVLVDEPRGAAVRRADRRARPAHPAVADRAHRRAARGGKTIVLATHDLEALPLLADRCVVFAEDHRVAATAPRRGPREDVALLQSTNLVHAHAHLHAGAAAPHAHAHDSGHH